eukprot:3864567-Rhodomonas_salina.1
METVADPVWSRRWDDLAHRLGCCCRRHTQNFVAVASDIVAGAGLVGVQRAYGRGWREGAREVQKSREAQHSDHKALAIYFCTVGCRSLRCSS